MSDRRYFVYIMTSRSLSAMYNGVTNDIGRRVFEWEDLIPEQSSSSPFESP
jgi:predicted GIY-YIG superfamily endonuclease